MASIDAVNVVQATANQDPKKVETMKMRRVGPAGLAGALAAGLGAAGAGFGAAAGAPAATASAVPAAELVGSAMTGQSPAKRLVCVVFRCWTRLRCSVRRPQVNRRRDN